MESKDIYEAVKHIPEDSSFGPDNISTLSMLGDKLPKGIHTFEIGTWYGRSAATWALATGGTVTALDICERTHQIAQDFMNKMGLGDRVKMVLGNSIKHEPEECDILWIDGDHSYEGCMNDIKRFEGKAKMLVCGHDYHSAWPGVIKAVDEYFGGKAKQDGNIWYYFK